MLYKEEAILIRSMDYGEGHKIITLYTLRFGKVSVMARGAKKLKSRHTGAVQLFTHAEYTYYKSGKMGTLNHADIIHSNEALRTDLSKTAYASYICEMVYRLVSDDDQGSSFLFHQLAASFQQMAEEKDLQIIAHIFELKMLKYAGYEPVLTRCTVCGKESGLSFIAVHAGGAACAHCAAGSDASSFIPIDEKTRKLLQLLQTVDLRRLGNINVSPQTKQKLAVIMRGFMEDYADVQYWKSRKFLDQMEKYFLQN